MSERPNIRKRIFIQLALSLLLIAGCVEFEEFSPIPQIEYQSIETLVLFDTFQNKPVTNIKLEFDFIDGDANFGVPKDIANSTDGAYPDSAKYNLIITINDKIDGIYTPKLRWNNDLERFDTFTIPLTITQNEKLDRVGQNKTVKGKITTYSQIVVPEIFKDTFQLEFFIRDRAYNRSNIEYSDDALIDEDLLSVSD